MNVSTHGKQHSAPRPNRNFHDLALLKRVERRGEFWTGKLGKEDEGVSLHALKAGFMQGFSLLLNGLESRVPAVSRLCASLEAHTRARCNANLYLTPAGAQAFEAHFDWMDAVVLQIEGAKTWTLYPPVWPLPRKGTKFKPARAQLEARASDR